MAYYTALTAAWNQASLATGASLPASVTGSLLTGLTTAQKITAVNAWALPNTQRALVPVTAVLNAIVVADFLALTTNQLQQMTLLLQIGGGANIDASVGTTVRGVFQTIFAGKTTTLSNLSALVTPFDGATMPWITTPVASLGGGLNGMMNANDATTAGLT